MALHENSILLIEMLRKSVRLLKSSDFAGAVEALSDTRVAIDEINRDKGFKESLLEDQDTTRKLVSELLALWHQVVHQHVVKAGDNSDLESGAERDHKLEVVWLLWPILHGLLWLQTESEDYEEKAAEIYGVLSLAMESKAAVKVLIANANKVLPLPKG